MADDHLRLAVAKLETEGIKAAAGEVILAKHDSPGHPDILRFIEPLTEAGHFWLAISIMKGYCGQHPEDESAQMRLDLMREREEEEADA